MRALAVITRALTGTAILLLLGIVAIEPARAACMSFAQARQAGLISKYDLKPAAAVKNAVEARTGGKVVSFEICEPGPVYQLTVMRPGGNVTTVREPAR